jgi:hypothetical protein
MHLNMRDQLECFAELIVSKLRNLGFTSPNLRTTHALLKTAYLTSITTEENRFTRGNVTFADPKAPDVNPPPRRRADYPGFTRFKAPGSLSVSSLTKLFRAVDQWSGSVAVFQGKGGHLFVWGICDQFVGQNVKRNREAMSGFSDPGILTLTVNGVGELSAFHGDLFLGRLRHDHVVRAEHEPFKSDVLWRRLVQWLSPVVKKIQSETNYPLDPAHVCLRLTDEWMTAIARICIGLRRLGTGGSLLITPSPDWKTLKLSNDLPYTRMRDSMLLKVVDELHLKETRKKIKGLKNSDLIPRELYWDEGFAETDLKDRSDELTGAVKLVTSFAAVDGVVLLDQLLAVKAFGVKIGSTPHVRTVYDGHTFSKRGTPGNPIDLSSFGTRHNSILRYCRNDCAAIGIIVSQDGHVRVAHAHGRRLLLWDNVKLLDYRADLKRYAKHLRNSRRRRIGMPKSQGYTEMPKSTEKLID